MQACWKLKFCTEQGNSIRLANRSCLTGTDLFYLRMMEMPVPPLSPSSALASLAPCCLLQIQRIILGSRILLGRARALPCPCSWLKCPHEPSCLVIIASLWKCIHFRFLFPRQDIGRLKKFQDLATTEVHAVPKALLLDGKLIQP